MRVILKGSFDNPDQMLALVQSISQTVPELKCSYPPGQEALKNKLTIRMELVDKEEQF